MVEIHKERRTSLIPENDDREDFSFSVGQAFIIAVALTPCIAVVVLGAYTLLWGSHSLQSATSTFGRLEILLPVMLISIAAHEGLHWIGYVAFARLPWKSARIGFSVRSFAAYVHSDLPVSASAYKRLVALPGVVLGVIPSCFGIGLELGWAALYGFLMLVAAGGDFAILWKIRSIAPTALVVDHPNRAGCQVLVP
jgi:hypothetical protein